MFTVNYSDVRLSAPTTNYLTQQDAKSPATLVRALQDAIDSGSLEQIEQASKDFINNDKRNETIMKHEQTISFIMNVMINKLESNDEITIESFASGFVRLYREECEVSRYGYGVIAPKGAIVVAIQRLLNENFFTIQLRENENGTIVKVYHVQ